MTQHCEVDLGLIDIAEQARKTFIETELLSLGENIKQHGLLMPLLVVANSSRFTLIAGERRLRAMRLVGITKAQVLVLNPMDAGDTTVVQFIENEFRSAMTPTEKAHAMLDIKQKKGWMNKELSARLQMDQSSATRYLALFDTIPAVREAAEAGKIGPNAWYSISQLPADQQAGLLAMHLSGMPAGQIAELSRKQRKSPSAGAKVKVNRIKCQVPGKKGTSVMVSGEAISLEDMIEALGELMKEAKKASDRGLDAKTFERVCRDLAKKG